MGCSSPENASVLENVRPQRSINSNIIGGNYNGSKDKNENIKNGETISINQNNKNEKALKIRNDDFIDYKIDINIYNSTLSKPLLEPIVKSAKNKNQNQKNEDNLVLKPIVYPNDNNDLEIKKQLCDILKYYKTLKNSYANPVNSDINNCGQTLNKNQNKLNSNFGLTEKIERDYENMRNKFRNLKTKASKEEAKLSEMNYKQFTSNEKQNILICKNIIERNIESFEN